VFKNIFSKSQKENVANSSASRTGGQDQEPDDAGIGLKEKGRTIQEKSSLYFIFRRWQV
jgi:hypothetical protein